MLRIGRGGDVRQFVGRAAFLLLAAALLNSGCRTTPVVVRPDDQRALDPAVVQVPPGFELRPFVRNLTAPTAIVFDADGNAIIAEGGLGDEPDNVRLFGIHP